MAAVAPLRLQQVNLLNTGLIPKRESFTARHILVWSVIALVAMGVLGWWTSVETGKLRREVAENAARLAAESAFALKPRLPGGEVAPTPQEIAALEQAWQARKSELEASRGARELLKRGLAGPDDGPSALLRLIARTLPDAAWLTEVRVAGERFDVSGKSLDAAVVNAWLEQLRASGFLAEKPMPALRIERTDAPAPSGGVLPVFVFSISAALAVPFAEEGVRP
jgi:hypothetical protein